MPVDIANVPSTGDGRLEAERRLLYSLLGISQADSWMDMDDYFRWDGSGGWLVQGVGSGTQTATTTDPGGALDLTTTAAANSSMTHTSGGLIVTNSKTKKWAFAVRMKISTAMDAQARCFFGITDAGTGEDLAVGHRANAANFLIMHGGDIGAGTGSNVDLGVALDTAYHIFRVRCLGDNVARASIDGGAEVSFTPTNGLTRAHLFRLAANGTTAADRRLVLDWHVAVGERA